MEIFRWSYRVIHEDVLQYMTPRPFFYDNNVYVL